MIPTTIGPIIPALMSLLESHSEIERKVKNEINIKISTIGGSSYCTGKKEIRARLSQYLGYGVLTEWHHSGLRTRDAIVVNHIIFSGS